VTDPNEALGEDVKEEPSQELEAVELHLTDGVAAGAVAVAEGEVFIGERTDAAVADRDAVGIARQVLEDLFGRAEVSAFVYT
jgi:hypothetical protein